MAQVKSKITKHIFKVKYLFILLIITTSCISDDRPAETSKTLKDDLKNETYVNLIEKQISNLPQNRQVAIGIVNDNSTEFIGVFKNDKNVLRATENTNKIFEIGSITKAFTGICLAHLVQEDKAKLSETLQQQFDFPLLSGGDITLLQLANHTSGLPRLPNNIDELDNLDMEDPYATYDVKHLESYLKNHVVLENKSGSTYQYSNIGMGALGYVLSKKLNKSYEEMVQDLILKPLQMTASTTLLNSVDKSRLTAGHDLNGNVKPYWNFLDVFSGTGSLKSSVKDMEKFIRKNFENDPAYNLAQKTSFEISEENTVGLGWSKLVDNNEEVLWHNGSTGGYSSILMIDKKSKKAVIILADVVDFHDDITNLCVAFMEHIKNLQ